MKIFAVKKSTINNNFSVDDIDRQYERGQLYERLTKNSTYKLGDVLECIRLESAQGNNGDLIFNSHKPNYLTIFSPQTKLNKYDMVLKIKDKNKVNISKNFILFFLTRPRYIELVDLKRRGSVIQSISVSDFLDIPLPKPKTNHKVSVKSESITLLVKELILAEEHGMHLSCCVLSGAILESILLELVYTLNLPDVVMKKFNQIEGLKELVSKCDIVSNDEWQSIKLIIESIQKNRNYIHAYKNKEIGKEEFEKMAMESILNIEELILYLGV